MDDDAERELIEMLEYAEDYIADAEDVIWNVDSTQYDGEVEFILNELIEDVWTVQNRLEELNEVVPNDD